MTVELKPCPFCGSEDIKDDVYMRDGREVVCRECKARVGAFNPDANARAIDAWNRRSCPFEPGEWIKWDGGDFQPVPSEMLVMVMLRDGSIEGPARTREFAGTDSCWKHRGSDGDIIAYRLSALTNTSGDDEAPVVASGVTPGQYEFAAERLTLSIEGELDGLCIEMDVARRIVDFVLTETFGRAPA